MPYEVDQELPIYTVRAFNYATASKNKIHSDEVAATLGYRGGLVPGVGVYSYMTVPIVQALGADWLANGSMTGKFINPVYDGEMVTVQARVTNADHLRLSVRAFNEAGDLCAIGEAAHPASDADPIHTYDYPLGHTPLENERLAPVASEIPSGHVLGTIEFEFDGDNFQGESGKFIEDMQETQKIYKGKKGVLHPALVPHLANQILARNVNLGPWIHTASNVRHHSLPEPGETVSLRGKISHAYENRGHDIAVMNLALFGEKDRLITHLTHTAIIRPAFLKEEHTA